MFKIKQNILLNILLSLMSFSGLSTNILREIIGNKAKEQISKRVIQENFPTYKFSKKQPL